MTDRNSPKSPNSVKAGTEIDRRPYRGRAVFGVNFRCGELAAWKAAQADYITHAHTCPACTDANRWPGGTRCPAGAAAWAAYLHELPKPPALPELADLPDLPDPPPLPDLADLPALPELADLSGLPDHIQDRKRPNETEPLKSFDESKPCP